MPARMTDQAAGYDLAAAIDAPLVLQPGARAMVGCGFALQLPPGYEVQIRPRSGLAAKHGITILNAPGTIDADYRGEVRVLLINHGQQAYTLEPGCRIAQMVLGRLVDVALQTVSSLDDSDRGASGFGSTGS
ncbi:MAG: dUTP diphosphatase [Deltaproteobacteria bacterium]|nr:MAG: dUTP diphosphatase [Deltaproteobacteria bacterium]